MYADIALFVVSADRFKRTGIVDSLPLRRYARKDCVRNRHKAVGPPYVAYGRIRDADAPVRLFVKRDVLFRKLLDTNNICVGLFKKRQHRIKMLIPFDVYRNQ